MQKTKRFSTAVMLVSLFVSALCLSGCAAALIAGGAVGGYAIAKNAESSNPPPSSGNKGFFGGK